jgi:hypothetical protein
VENLSIKMKFCFERRWINSKNALFNNLRRFEVSFNEITFSNTFTQAIFHAVEILLKIKKANNLKKILSILLSDSPFQVFNVTFSHSYSQKSFDFSFLLII